MRVGEHARARARERPVERVAKLAAELRRQEREQAERGARQHTRRAPRRRGEQRRADEQHGRVDHHQVDPVTRPVEREEEAARVGEEDEVAVAEPAARPAERRCGPHEEGSVEEELQHDVPHRRLAVEPARVDRAPALGEREQDGREVAPDPGAERGVLVEEGQERRQAEVAGRRRGAEGADDRLVEEGAERAVGREVEERRRHHERGAPRERERAADLARALGREQDGQAERRAHAEAVVLLAEDGRADARARAEGVGAEHEHDRPCEERRRERGVAHDLPVREGPDAVAEEEPCEAERPGARHDGARGAEEEGREHGERAHREETRGPDRRPRHA